MPERNTARQDADNDWHDVRPIATIALTHEVYTDDPIYRSLLYAARANVKHGDVGGLGRKLESALDLALSRDVDRLGTL